MLAQPHGGQNAMMGRLDYILTALLALCLVAALWAAVFL